ncbi:MAG: ATP-binding cassette domain-containing protein [Gemmatimonadaceae bacterium]|nr:ATP-binding cassette domain-containing protein [Gemmatimonadaceae bacterium]
MAPPVLVLRSLWSAWTTKRGVGGHHARAAISVSLEPGQWLVVIGWNGAGKSTLLRGIAGSAPVCGGRVEVDGRHLRPHSRFDRFRVGMVYVAQEPALPGTDQSWSDAVALAMGSRPGLYNEAALMSLKNQFTELGLVKDDRIVSPLFDLVTGILSAPSVLILDEIDARAKSALRHDDGYLALKSLLPMTAVVLVEHDVAAGLKAADRVLLLHRRKPPSVISPSEAVALLIHNETVAPPTPSDAHRLPYYCDAERLLELDNDPIRLLRRAMMAGRVVNVRQWIKRMITDWPFVQAPEIGQLSGGQRIILCALAAAAAGIGQFDERLVDHVHRDSRVLLRKYRTALSSVTARERDSSRPEQQLSPRTDV